MKNFVVAKWKKGLLFTKLGIICLCFVCLLALLLLSVLTFTVALFNQSLL